MSTAHLTEVNKKFNKTINEMVSMSHHIINEIQLQAYSSRSRIFPKHLKRGGGVAVPFHERGISWGQLLFYDNTRCAECTEKSY